MHNKHIYLIDLTDNFMEFKNSLDTKYVEMKKVYLRKQLLVDNNVIIF